MSDERSLLFHNFEFGFVSAETESARNPALLARGFIDLNEIIHELTDGYRFVVLGNKGSGKSAIAQHLLLTAETSIDSRRFVSVTQLQHFPYSDLRSLTASGQTEYTYPVVWTWLLLLKIFDSFTQDQGSNCDHQPDLVALKDVLIQLGLLQSSGLKELLFTIKKRGITFELAGIKIENSREQRGEQQLPFLTERIKKTMLQFTSRNKHFLLLDDLDGVLTTKRDQLTSLAALVEASKSINDDFARNNVPAKILLLCRTDLFDRIPGPNNNKIRQDDSIRLNWHTGLAKSPLWSLADLRASMWHDKPIDVLDEYFPKELKGVSRGAGRILPAEAANTGSYLLRHTRYIPRDFVALLNSIQLHSRASNVTSDAIAAALLEYSQEYFLPEIHNELSGYFEEEEISTVFEKVGRIRDSLFRLNAFEGSFRQSIRPMVHKMLNAMFDCSAIGNWERGSTPGLRTYKYKFPSKHLNPDLPIMLHPALALAFNIAKPQDAVMTNLDISGDTDLGIEGTISLTAQHMCQIKTNQGHIYFCQIEDIVGHKNLRLCVGDRVVFEPDASVQGRQPQAKNVRLVTGTKFL